MSKEKLNKRQQQVYNWLKDRPGYLKKSSIEINRIFDFQYTIEFAKSRLKGELKRSKYEISNEVLCNDLVLIARPLDFHKTTFNPDNVLIIGDTHLPFSKEGYLEHCIEVQKKYDCGTVIHIGDLVDNHAVSYHESDVDGRSAGDEYKLALEECAKWYKAFPNVKICIGNHDRLPFRKAFTAGLPKNWLKSYQEMFNSPPTWEWDFVHKVKGVIYQHGTGMSGEMASVNAARENRQSTVIGHLHTVCNTRYLASEKDLIFGMSVGCGIDHTKYAFAYGREATRKPVLGCAVVINGKLPINIPMIL
jgi:predicted phosphodiesterase